MKVALTQQQANDTVQALISQSILFVIVEYRGFKCETIGYIDKKTGQKTSFSRLVFNVETISESADQIMVTMRVPEDYTTEVVDGVTVIKPLKPETPPFSTGLVKGQRVLFKVDTVERKMGHTTFDVSSFSPIEQQKEGKK